MDKASAVNLIVNTFESSFDKSKFATFTKNLLKTYDDSKTFSRSGSLIKEAFRQVVSHYERLGRYTDPDGKHIDILIVYLQKASSLYNARTAQRNFLRWYIKDGNNASEKDAVLAAIVSPDKDDWRFSLVKMELELGLTASGSISAIEELTPAKRYSFIVGANEHSHTAKQNLLPLLEQSEATLTLSDIENAFNIETITKEFFEKYQDLYMNVKNCLDDLVKKDAAIREDFSAKGVDTSDFAKKLLGQIVFLYFLQKKGWFGVPRGQRWGGGPKNFMRLLFNKDGVSYSNFFNDVLEPLFYDALSVDRRGNDDWYDKLRCKVPFLNGGLFDPINGYAWYETDIIIPNELFSNTKKTKEGDVGDGVLDVFDRYNFTVCEDEPLEKEVAVDPEMLGKVFENLLEVKDRKSKGTYYTPREIVHYMCQESLVNYLATECPAVDKAIIEVLIKQGEAAIENDAAAAKCEEEGKDTYTYKLPEAIRHNARDIDSKLESIKICDPAVGSGAFLVGMMNEIVRTRLALASHTGTCRTAYDLKRNAIQNTLYGVDLDPGAVEIAKLRLWLSLVVDEDDRDNIQPLPNLDYKVMQGNTLLEEYEGVKLFDESLLANDFDYTTRQKQAFEEQIKANQAKCIELHNCGKLTKEIREQLEDDSKKLKQLIRKLEQSSTNAHSLDIFSTANNSQKLSDQLTELHKRYFNTAQKHEKDELKLQIDTLEWELIESSLKEQGKEASLQAIREQKQANIKPFFLWKLNYPEVFEEKGGFDVVIANPPYISYGLRGGQKMTPVEKELLKRVFPNSAEYKISMYALFIDKAIQISRPDGGVQSFIVPDSFLLGRYFSKIRGHILASNEIHSILLLPFKVFDATVGYPVVYLFQKIRKSTKQNMVSARFCETSTAIAQACFKQFSYPQNYFLRQKHNRFRLFFDKATKDFVESVEVDSIELGRFMTGRTGVRSLIGQKNIVSKEKKSATWQRGIVSGGQVLKYSVFYQSDYINIDPNLLNKGGWDYDIIHNPKLLLRQTGDSLTAAIDYDGLYHLNNVHSFAPNNDELDILYLLALLNSSLMDVYYKCISLEENRTMAQTDIETLECLPIRKPNEQQNSTVVSFVRDALLLANSSDYRKDPKLLANINRILADLDKIIYDIYGLSYEHVSFVERRRV